jgi:WD40 repeat protein
MGYGQLAAILGVCTDQIGIWIQPLEDLLRFQATPPSDQSSASTEEWRISFDHASLEQWLTERSGGRIPGPRAGRYGVNRDEAAEQIRTWALAEVKAHRAHTSPYLVRHLASHLNAEERPELIASQLRQFAWLQARLHLAGLNALLGDFDRTTDGPANFPPELQRVGRALRQGAHVLSHEGGWNGQEQLASQLLARLADDGALEGLRLQAAAWLKKVGRAYPRTSSLLAQAALLRTLLVGGFVTSLVILPDGRLACGRQDGSIHLWDSASGSCSAVFEGHQGWVKALVVLSDGRLASGATVDHTIRIWDPVTCACSAVLEGHQDGINTLTVLPDGDLASGSSDSTIRIWDLLSLSCRAVFEQHVRPVTALGVLMDGRLISMSSAFWGETADADQILIWDPKAGDYLEVFADVSHDAPLAIMPDGRIAFVFNSTLEGGSVHLWDVATASCSAVLHGHSTGVGAIAVLPDGRLATAYWDNTIHVWDLTTGTFSAVLHGESIEGGVDAMAVFPDGRIASAFDDAIHIWDPSIRDCFAIREGDKGPVHALVSLSDGHVASACGYQEGIRIWDPDKGSCIAVLDGHTQTIYSLAVLPDGRLASGSYDKTIRIWDPDTGSCLAILEGHEKGVYALAVLPDGRLASGSWDETIRLWDINIGTCSAIFEGLKGYVQALAVLPDGRLASGSSQTEDTIRICDPANGSCIAFLDGHEKRVDALAVLPDGRLASCSGDDGTIRLWDISTGACSAILHGSAGEMAVIPDGRLASVSNGNCILLRDLASPGRNPEVIFVTDAMITALMALPGKSLLVAGDYGGRLHWLELGGQRP